MYGSDASNDSDRDSGAQNVVPLIPGGPQSEGRPNEAYPDNFRGQSGELAEPLIQETLPSLTVQIEGVTDDVGIRDESFSSGRGSARF